MKKLLLLPYLLILLTPLFSIIDNGFIDIRDYNFESNGPLNLSGNWSLSFNNQFHSYSKVPGDWDKSLGDAYFSLKILNRGEKDLIFSPSQVNSQYTLFLNKEEIITESNYRLLYIPLKLVDGENVIEFHITNNSDPVGGIRSIPHLGSKKSMLERYTKNVARDTFFAGSSFIIFIFFLILFFKYNKEKSNLYFALLCLALSLRGLVTNDKVLFLFLPEILFFIVQRVEYLAVYSLPLVFILFIKNYFDYTKHNKLYTILISIISLFPLTVIFLPPLYYKSILFLYFIVAIISMVITLVLLLIYLKHGLENSLKILISISVIIIGAVYDIIVVLYTNSEIHILSIVLIIFILFMLYDIFRSETIKLERSKNITKENIRINMYLSKFVPENFIKTVGLGDLLSIKKGDGVDKNMTIIFTSIVDFRKEMKLHKAEEVIKNLNQCYNIITPIIESYGGFVDKFIDETMMALFPGKSDDAVEAVLEMNRKIEDYNRLKSTDKPIKLRTGIHKGSQHIGIVGDKYRVDATVISKVVNTSSRIHSFSYKIDKSILVSEDLINSLENKNKFSYIFMGDIKLKGNDVYMGIYSISDSNISEADKLFSTTMHNFRDNTLYPIEDVLLKIKKLYINHTPTNYYLNLIKKNKRLEDIDK